jgi:hypothetical protein
VNENKLRKVLETQPGEYAARLITDLVIERQLEKIKSRRENTRRDQNINEDEKW